MSLLLSVYLFPEKANMAASLVKRVPGAYLHYNILILVSWSYMSYFQYLSLFGALNCCMSNCICEQSSEHYCDVFACSIHSVFSYLVLFGRAAQAPLSVPAIQDATALSALRPYSTTDSPQHRFICRPRSSAGYRIPGAAV